MPTNPPERSDAHGVALVRDAPLASRNTFGVVAKADRLVELHDADALPAALAALGEVPRLILGSGSNLLLTGDVAGGVLAVATRGRRIIEDDGRHALVEAEAGENWHEFVVWTLGQGLYGLQNLSLIPGTVGAAPVQNIGAYGVELESLVDSLDAVELRDGRPVRLERSACEFAYRDSRFRRSRGDRLLILRVRLRLSRDPIVDTTYSALQAELDARGVSHPTPAQVSAAVCAIRRRRLPDPARIGNAGSFFKNPVVDQETLAAIRVTHPEAPVFPAGAAGVGAVKLSAAWLIERCGWKGRRLGAAGVHAEHSLVLVNHGGATGAQILELADRIRASVRDAFGIELEPEPTIA